MARGKEKEFLKKGARDRDHQTGKKTGDLRQRNGLTRPGKRQKRRAQ